MFVAHIDNSSKLTFGKSTQVVYFGSNSHPLDPAPDVALVSVLATGGVRWWSGRKGWGKSS